VTERVRAKDCTPLCRFLRCCVAVGLVWTLIALAQTQTGLSRDNHGQNSVRATVSVAASARDAEIDPQAKAMYLAALAARDELLSFEVEARIEAKQTLGSKIYHYRATELTIVDRARQRYFFQQEKEILQSSSKPRNEWSRVLIRDGIIYTKVSRDPQALTLETVKNKAELRSVKREVQMSNLFLLGMGAIPLHDFGPGVLANLRNFENVRALRLGQKLEAQGVLVQELVFRTSRPGIEEEDEWTIWIDPVKFRILRVEMPGRQLIVSTYEDDNTSPLPNRVEATENADGRRNEVTIELTRLNIDLQPADANFELQRLQPALNDLVFDYDQQRIVGRWNGRDFLGEQKIDSPQIDQAVAEHKRAAQDSIPWLTICLWGGAAILGTYMIVRWTQAQRR